MKKNIFPVLAAVLLFFSACSRNGGGAKSADLNTVMAKMKETITNTEMMDLSAEDLMPDYGIDPDDVKQFAVYVDSTGTKGDEIILAEGKDDASASRIQEKLEARYKQKEVEMKDYLPEEYAVLEECGVTRNGNYVDMIVSPQHEDLEKIYNDAVG